MATLIGRWSDVSEGKVSRVATRPSHFANKDSGTRRLLTGRLLSFDTDGQPTFYVPIKDYQHRSFMETFNWE